VGELEHLGCFLFGAKHNQATNEIKRLYIGNIKDEYAHAKSHVNANVPSQKGTNMMPEDDELE
jgi:hypothetical protein